MHFLCKKENFVTVLIYKMYCHLTKFLCSLIPQQIGRGPKYILYIIFSFSNCAFFDESLQKFTFQLRVCAQTGYFFIECSLNLIEKPCLILLHWSHLVLQWVVNFWFRAGSGYCNPGSGPGTGIPLNLKPGQRVPPG